MTLALGISFHDEVKPVRTTLRGVTDRLDICVLAQSTDGQMDESIQDAVRDLIIPVHTTVLPDLGPSCDHYSLPTQALLRNYSAIATHLGEKTDLFDYAAFCTGDTVLLHPYGVRWIIQQMDQRKARIGCARAIGQDFHAAERTLEELESGTHGGRLQTPELMDFMPQFFVVAADLVSAFTSISVTNRWCTEQCLGDVLVRHGLGPADRFVFSETATGFADGVLYHCS